MDRFEVLLLINTAVAIHEYNYETKRIHAPYDVNKSIDNFGRIMSRFYHVDTKKNDVLRVKQSDIKKNIINDTDSRLCNYEQYVVLILDMLLQIKNIYPELVQTGWTKSRLEATLKSLFLVYKYGGVKGMLSLLQIFYEMILCPTAEPSLESSLEGQYSCLECTSDKKLEDRDFMANPRAFTVIFLDYEKLSKTFKIPFTEIPTSFYIDCNNPVLAQFKSKNIIKQGGYMRGMLVEGDDICKANCASSVLCGKKPEPPSENYTTILLEKRKALDLLAYTAFDIVYKIYLTVNRRDLKYCRFVDYARGINSQIKINSRIKDVIKANFQLIEMVKEDDCEFTTANAPYEELQPVLWRDDLRININYLTDLANTKQLDTRPYYLTYALRRCFINEILRNFRYDFLKIGMDGEFIENSKIFFEKDNFSTLFDADVLSDTSSQGIVWKLKFHGRKNPFFSTLKYASGEKDEISFYNIIHELAVGLVLNSLKSSMPTFMYTWGGFLCSPPERLEKRADDGSVEYKYEYSTMCAETPDKSQIILLSEFIQGKSLASMMEEKSLTFQDIIGILFQVACALKKAQEEFNFCHNDLHWENLLVKHLEQPMKFAFDGKVIMTKYIPIIIDYGYATLTYKGIFLPVISGVTLLDMRNGELVMQDDISDMLTLFVDVQSSIPADKFVKYKQSTLSAIINALYEDIEK
jgi:serine/threonine protein kinase